MSYAPSNTYSKDQNSLLITNDGTITITSQDKISKNVTGTLDVIMKDNSTLKDIKFKNVEFNMNY